jgi:2-amino-4-hydroxy-6-hydroxymethyldihydropteridine diphosphokinase
MSGNSTESLPVGLALGSNLGDRLAHLRAARDFLCALHESGNDPLVSSVYATDPVDCPPGSPPFLNAVLEIITPLGPEELLVRASAFERHLGRPDRRERNAPRPVDIDLLYAGNRCIKTTRLVIPHPRLAQRRFVLQPLAEIRADLVLPGQSCRVADLLAALPPDPPVRTAAEAW